MNGTVYDPGEKTHRDENFPVASYLIRKRHRGAVLAFYRFARAADNVADHPGLTEAEKLARLDCFEETLLGNRDAEPAALPLRAVLAARGLTPRHALDLLTAFRQDARQSRYRDWEELERYCFHSAAPVGRFVLEVHGENIATWSASDALCNALQIVNHLQDCKADYLRLNRVYVPQETLARHGIDENALGLQRASPALSQVVTELAEKTRSLLAVPLSGQVADLRLAIEVAIIEGVVRRLLKILKTRDPLCDRVHLNKAEYFWIALCAVTSTFAARLFARRKTNLSAEAA